MTFVLVALGLSVALAVWVFWLSLAFYWTVSETAFWKQLTTKTMSLRLVPGGMDRSFSVQAERGLAVASGQIAQHPPSMPLVSRMVPQPFNISGLVSTVDTFFRNLRRRFAGFLRILRGWAGGGK